MKKLIPTEIDNILSLTSMQEGMLFHYLKDPRSDLYFEQLSLEISGSIDADFFKKAWNVVIQANEMLRTVFRWEKLEKPSQVILKEHTCELNFYDLSKIEKYQKRPALAEIKANDRDKGFDLTHVPFRVILCKLDEKKCEMIISNHHILYDGWSNGILLKEFFSAYHALSKGEQTLPFPIKLSIKEYIKWLQSRDRKNQEFYWQEYLAGFETATELPIKRKKEDTRGAGHYSIILGTDIQNKLNVFIKNNKVTLASVFYSAWGLLLQKYCGSEDILFGTTVSGRSANLKKGIEDMVGLFINTIPLRINTYPGETIVNVVSRTDQLLREREEFEHTPLIDIRSRDVTSGRDVARNVSTLFDTIVVIENYPLDSHLIPEGRLLSVHSYSMVETTHYDLTVGIMPFNEIEIKFSFKQELFENDVIKNLAGHFKTIIQKMIEQPEIALSQLEIISIEEKNRILNEFNNTAVEYPQDKTIHQLFTEQASKTPDYIAVIGHGQTRTNTDNNVGANRHLCVCPGLVRPVQPVQLSYHQLNEQSDGLAGVLIEKGVLSDTIVAIMMERSLEMIINIMGILKAGGGYLPIDPEYPQERIDYMLKDSDAKMLIRRAEKEGIAEKTSTLPRFLASNSSNLAYVIYTSGSTGRPKGVMINHGSVVNLLFALQKKYLFSVSDTYLLKTSYTFDVSVTELFGWYMGNMGGGKLAILEVGGEKDPQVMLDWIHRHKVTYINFVPSMFNAFLKYLTGKNKQRFACLKYIFLAGEALLPGLVKKFKNLNIGISLENLYGPTEGTVYSSQYSLSGWNGTDNVPIGKPLANIKLYILNKYNHLQRVGIPGELYIGGKGVARGYLNNPELTCKKFRPLMPQMKNKSFFGGLRGAVFSKKAPLGYKTGDLARWLSNGNIEFLGRIDQQVKIRGFRVELGEIENHLLKHKQIKEAVICTKEDAAGDKYLAAYFVSDIELLDTILREYLAKDLPEYMIPSYFIRLAKIPLTSSGKVDRKRLPEPKLKREETYIAPRNDIEKKLVEIWGNVLGKDLSLNPIGINDHFFRMGGHSLKATSLAALIHKTFNVKIPLAEIFKRPTIRQISDYIKRAVGKRYESIELVEEKEYYALSSAQKRLYFLQQLDTAGTVYNMPSAWILEGELDKSHLEKVFNKLIKRHESLRTSFIMINEEPVQRIHDEVAFEIEFKDLATENAEVEKKKRRREEDEKIRIEDFVSHFDLTKAPLIRVLLAKLEDEKHLLMVDMHHIISDGISAEILVREFTALYQGKELPTINLQYKDYAEWQNCLKQEENFLRQKSYWKKEFAGEMPVLELPLDYPRPPVQSFAGDRITFAIEGEMAGSINTFALETGMTLYMVLLASYSIFLAKLSGQEDIIIGTPIGGRRYADFEKIIGVFVNTLIIRNYPAGEKSLIEFLGEIKEKALGAFENQDYQYEDLVDGLRLNRDAGRNLLFDVMFVLQNMENTDLEIPGLKIAPYDFENKTAKFDLTLTAVEIKGKLEFTFEYCTKLFKSKTIERFITYYKNVLSSIIQDKGKRLADLEILPGSEKNRLLYKFNNTEAEYPQDKTIHQLFEELASKTPDYIAIVGDGDVEEKNVGADLRVCPISLTYRQLNNQSDRLAGLLIGKDVLPDTIVGIMMERSIEMIIGILGILKSGGAYMPIDPGYPQERIDYMLKDSGVKLLAVANDKESEKVRRWEGETVLLESISYDLNHLKGCSRRGLQHSNHLSYVIYTSGTTGQPKGSLIEHGNVVRLLFNDKFQFDFSDRDIWTLFHSFCFDFSVWEMYGALLYGGKLVIVPKMTARDTRGFLGLLGREAVTVLNQTPSAFYNLINEALISHQQEKKLYLRYVIFGGEALSPLKLKDWLEKYPQTRLINMFGITETTVHVTYKEITQEDIELNFSNIGNPIPTLKVYLLDRYLKPVPVGVTGEICVGGKGVCRGYLNRPELTAEKFIFSPNVLTSSLPNFPLYRSGDLARFLANGDIEYLGRIDQQVKIRGFRIEVGEIEDQLLKYDGIKDAVVLAEEANAEKYLCAYIVPYKEFNITEVRTHLAAKLPDYMIPSYFVRLEQIPLTSNGKIDKKALPGVHGNDDLWEGDASPTTETEEKLAGLWAKILGIKPGVNGDFFHSGGDSIKAVRLVNSINTELSIHLKIADIYLHSTIRKLASLIERDKTVYEYYKYTKEELKGVETEIARLKNNAMPVLQLPEGIEIEDIYPMSDIQKGMVFHSLKDSETGLYHDQMVYQPVINDFNPDIFKKAFALLVEKHSILRTVFIYNRYEEPVQAVYGKVPHDIEHADISHMEKDEQENYLLRFLAEDRSRPFQFDMPPLWRLRTFALGHSHLCVILAAHHAILDGWSVAALDTELLNTYWQLKSNPAFRPVMLKNSYKAFIIEQEVEKKRGDAANFWKNELDGYQRLELLENNRNIGNTIGKYHVNLGKNLLSKVQETAKIHHTTIKSLCFSAYIYMLFMLSYEHEMVIGLVTNNRPVCEDGDKILGCFLNTIPVRIIIPARISWLDYLKQVDRKLLELKKYERMPLFEIVRIIGENTQNRNPLFDVIFNFIDFHVLEQIEQDYGKGNTGKLHINENVNTNTAFDFSVSTTLGDFELIISYSESFFNEKMVGDLCCYFERVLNKFIAEPGGIANKIELLPVEERHRLLYEFNDTAADYPKDKTIHELFVEQVEKTPDYIAIVGNADVEEKKRRREKEKNVGADLRVCPISLTYCQLNEQFNQLAGLLIEKGVLPDTIVGIMMGHSVEMIIGIMGILKAGGAYMPIDPEYPQERIDYMLKDSDAKMLIRSAEERKSASSLPRFLASNSSNLAYIIYTSGSTGRPKGVMVTHQNVVRLVKNTNYIEFLPGDSILQTGAMEFDASTFEVWGAILNGLKLILVNKETILIPEKLKAALRGFAVSTIWMTSPLFNQMLQEDSEIFAGLKNLLVGGDVLSPSHINRLRSRYPQLNVINGYGPTENTTFSTTCLLQQEYMDNIPIGKPIANSTAYIIDKYNQLQPIGVPGELLLGGDGIARGYLNNPELTAEKFIFSPNFLTSSLPNFLLYRTGDLARWISDGDVEFLGRIDHQVKIRGFRIELGEIENQLLKHKYIKEVVVVINEDAIKDKNLTAYIVSTEELHEIELREYLQQKLPDYMIPSYFVWLGKIPLTSNGKLDRKALPKPELKASESYIAPRNEIETKLVEIWSDVLGKDELHAIQLKTSIGIGDNFFQLGGHSLKATILVSQIEKCFNVKIPLAEIFKNSKIKDLSRYIKNAAPSNYKQVLVGEKKEYYALSSAQKRLHFLWRMDKDGTAYNIPAAWILEGILDKDKLENTLVQLIRRHESFRTSFIVIGEEPVQRIHGSVEFEIDDKNCSWSTDYSLEKDTSLLHSSFIFHHFIRAFDLSKAPLLRVSLLKLAEEKHSFLVDMHHIISDGMSIHVLIQDFLALYSGKKLPEIKLHYKDYAEWQSQEKLNKKLIKQGEYWLKELEGEIPILELPTDYIRPSIQNFEGNRINFEINKENSSLLKTLALETGTTLYIVLLALYTILLSRLSGQEDIVIGSPIAGRRHPDLEKIIGMFVNTLALRNYPIGGKNFSDFLEEVKEKTLKAFENQEYEFEDLVEQVVINRDASRNPLFDVMFVLQNIDIVEIKIPGLKLIPDRYKSIISKFDMTLSGIEKEGKIIFTFEYCTKLFKLETIERFIGYFNTIVFGVIKKTWEKISDFEIITEEEKKQILVEFNDTAAEYPKDKTIHQLFAEQASKTPDYIAIVGDWDVEEKKRRREEEKNGGVETLRATSLQYQYQITYHQLNQQSNRLAGLLIAKGALPDMIIGIMMERSIELIIGILGILKAGGAYLPIDPEYPQDRIDYMLKDSNAKVLIINKSGIRNPKLETNSNETNSNDQNKNRNFGIASVLNFEHLDFDIVSHFVLRASNLIPSNLAYIIYTSGSTGQPKGVMVEHRQLVNFIYHMFNRYDGNVGCNDRCLSLTNIMFDVSVWEFFLPLLFGAQLILTPWGKGFDVFELTRRIIEVGITLIYLPPGLLQPICEQLKKQPGQLELNKMLVGVEPIRDDILEDYMRLNPGLKIINGYGPTETTICATSYNYFSHEPVREIVPIGVPLSNTQVILLDAFGCIVPQGIPGEICISGDGVSRGYLNKPELTAEKFIFFPNLLTSTLPNFPLYRTGDMARLLPDGNLLFIGRRDNQLKIRGYRIELGEIENRLLKHPGIREVVILSKEDAGGNKYLAAYFVSDRELTGSELKKHLLNGLPDYMIPSFFMQLEKIPLTSNGKINREALPELELAVGESYMAPRNEIEKKLVGLWAEILSNDALHTFQLETSIGIDDDFFKLGGHSLKAAILVSKIHKAFHVIVPLAEIFITPTIRGLANYIKVSVKDRYASIKPIEKKEYYMLSSAQKRLYILYQMDSKGVGYNIPSFSILEGEIDKDRLAQTFKLLIERHESLRTSIHLINDDPVQRIQDEVEFEIEYLAAEGTEVEKKKRRREEDEKIRIEDFVRHFDLTKAPLIRVLLAKRESEKHLLMVDMHHIISDGTSMNILIKDFMALYQNENLSELRVQYKDFSAWQNCKKQKESIKRQEDFWLKEFEGDIPVLGLPFDYPRPTVQNFEGSQIPFEIDKKTSGALKTLVSELEVTMYMVLLALYTIFLAKITNQVDIVIGLPIAGRRHADLEEIIGMFVNTLTLRNYPSGEKPFFLFLQEVKEKTLKTFENQDYHYEDLVDNVAVARDLSRNPLFDTMFALQNMEMAEINIPGLKLSPYPYENKTAKFDLSLTAVEAEEKLFFNFEYSTKLFKHETIERFIAYFENIVSGAIENNDRRISDFEIITAEEKKRILVDFNDTEREYPKDKTIHQLFEEQAAKRSDQIAIIEISIQITYGEFNKRANRLGRLLKSKGAGANRIIGLMAERSIEMMVGILGILKSGGAYLPIDIDYPPERKKYMLEDSESPLVLARSNFTGSFNFKSEIIDIETGCSCGDSHNFEIITNSQNLIYMIYTSGSTGRPKGVMVKIEGFLNLLYWYLEELGIREKENILLIAPISFDLAQKNLFSSHLVGGRLTLAPPGIPDYRKLSEIIHKEQVSLINCAPSVFYPLIELNSESDYMNLKPLRRIILGGEPIQIDKLSGWVNSEFFDSEIVNTYGPTECSDIASSYRIPAENFKQKSIIPIGKPISNVKIYILDKYQNVLPVGIPGELYIGGTGLSQGYCNNIELTAEKFVEISHLPEKKVYQTGDLSRWTAKGTIEFLGRIDHQVKVRGIRIELEEIESVLLTYREIKDAIVVAREREKGHNYLCAYIIVHKNFSLSELREHLAQHLPYYMIPSYFWQLEKIPLTPSGKVDREALPNPDLIVLENNEAPQDMVEKKLLHMWAEILKTEQEKISIDSSFFDLGGNSLHAMRLQTKIHKEFYIIFPVIEIFKSPTIRKLAEYIKASKKDGFTTIPPAEEKEYYPLTLPQQGLYLHLQLELASTAYNIPSITQLDGELNLRKLETVFQKLLKHHESLRTSFEIINNFPVQRIHNEVDLALEYYETTSSPDDIIRNFIRPFDLTKAPLLHGGVIKNKNDQLKHILMLDVHHLVTDGVSQAILINDIMALYAGKDLPRQKIRYRDFSEWLNNDEERKRKKQDNDYWLEQFNSNIPVLKLPTDYARPALQSFEGSTVTFEIGPEETAKLKSLALEEDATLFMVMLAIYNILLAKLSRQEDIIVGTPTAARPHIDLEPVVGMFVITLPIRNFPSRKKTFQEFLNEVKKNTLAAFNHQDCHIENLVKQIRTIDTGRDRLFEVLLTFQNMETLPSAPRVLRVPRAPSETVHETIGLQMKPYPFQNTSAKFDLNFVMAETADQLSITIEYCAKIFKEETVQDFAKYFSAVILLVLNDKEIVLEDIDISSGLQEVTIELPETGFVF